jgi:hypothetical protein
VARTSEEASFDWGYIPVEEGNQLEAALAQEVVDRGDDLWEVAGTRQGLGARVQVLGMIEWGRGAVASAVVVAAAL